MVLITDAAQAQLEALEDHYARLGRDQASIRMAEAVAAASMRIEAQAGPFRPAPRPYPELEAYGWQWLKQGRYWIAFSAVPGGYAVNAVFFETVDIPGRLRPNPPRTP